MVAESTCGVESAVSTYLHLFGRLDVEHDGLVTPLVSERRNQLLARLALERTWIDRSELAALLWPERDPKLAQANLRKALHFARALPWTEALDAQGNAMRFAVNTDVHDFEVAAAEGRTADALGLYRGELLDGLDDDSNPVWSEWLAAERARLGRRRRTLARERLHQLEGAPRERAVLARELLDDDPLDEHAVAALLAAQRVLGQFTEQRETYRMYCARLAEELGVKPSSQVTALVVSAEAAAAVAAADNFIGRARELEELAGLLARSECRLITVTGPGGVGKSHLVKQALRSLALRFASGAIWIPLDDLTEPQQVVARIAAELGLAPGPLQDPMQRVCAQPKLRELLLVLDNGEQLAGLARLVERLLADTGGLKLCVTSRARLGVRGEWLLPLQGLAVPPTRAATVDLLASDASRLFVRTARAVRPDFDAAAQSHAIGALVRAVDGLPLAILLAANWTRLLTVREIAAELEYSLDVLEAADEGEERPEHRSVRATFEQSWRLLTPDEQRALQALSVFVGTFPLAAAREVAGAGLPLLAALADWSLLQMLEGGRCALHPLIRQFAGEKLDVAMRSEAARRHAAWFHRLLARLDRAFEAGEPDPLREFDQDLEDCRAAWRWAIAEGALDQLAGSAVALLCCFETRGRALEGLALLREAQMLACAQPSAPACAANVVSAIAHLQYRAYRIDEAIATARQGLKFARAAGSRIAVFRCLNVLGLCEWQQGRNVEALRIFEQALRHARAGNDRRRVLIALGNVGLAEKTLGHYERARALMLEVLAQQRELGDWVGVSTRLINLAALHQARAEWDQARRFLEQGLAMSEEHGIAYARPHLVVNLALVAFFSGDLDEAERVGLESLREARASANGSVESTMLVLLVRIAVRRADHRGARTHLRDAIGCSVAMRSVPMQLDCVFCFAEMLAAGERTRDAAALMRYYIARPEIEPGDRAVAQAALEGLAGPGADAAPPDVALDALLDRILDEIGGSPVAPTGSPDP